MSPGFQQVVDGVQVDLPPGSDVSVTLEGRLDGGGATLAAPDSVADSLAAMEGESVLLNLEGSFAAAEAAPLRIRVDTHPGETAAIAIAVDEDGALHFLGLPVGVEGGNVTLDVDLGRLAEGGDEEEDGAVLISPGRVAKLWIKKVLHLPDRSLGLFEVAAGPGETLTYTKAQAGARNAPHALIVHGALSEARAMEDLSRLLMGAQAPREYDAILAFDYETVATGVERNGETLRDALVAAGFGGDRMIDVYAYSMGTQVTRAMVELGGGSDLVRDVVLIAPPNGGTRIADDEDRALVWGGLLVNAAALTVGWAGPLGAVFSSMFRIVEKKDDGLDALRSDSVFRKKLEAQGDPGHVRYRTIAGSTEVAPAFLRRTLNSAANVYHRGPNDWIVPLSGTSSPYDEDNETVDEHHFGYFREDCLPIGWVLDAWLS
jgi:hypothetical protein